MGWQSDANHGGWGVIGKLMKFSLVGASGVVVNTAALFSLHQLAGLPLLIASPLAVECSIVNNFVWNDRWTFGIRPDTWQRFFKFNLVSLGGLAIATGVLYGLVTLAGIHYLLANLVGIGMATLWNFSLNLFWTWREPS